MPFVPYSRLRAGEVHIFADGDSPQARRLLPFGSLRADRELAFVGWQHVVLVIGAGGLVRKIESGLVPICIARVTYDTGDDQRSSFSGRGLKKCVDFGQVRIAEYGDFLRNHDGLRTLGGQRLSLSCIFAEEPKYFGRFVGQYVLVQVGGHQAHLYSVRRNGRSAEPQCSKAEHCKQEHGDCGGEGSATGGAAVTAEDDGGSGGEEEHAKADCPDASNGGDLQDGQKFIWVYPRLPAVPWGEVKEVKEFDCHPETGKDESCTPGRPTKHPAIEQHICREGECRQSDD